MSITAAQDYEELEELEIENPLCLGGDFLLSAGNDYTLELTFDLQGLLVDPANETSVLFVEDDPLEHLRKVAKDPQHVKEGAGVCDKCSYVLCICPPSPSP